MQSHPFCRSRPILLFFLLAALVIPVATMGQAWYNSNWTYRKAITIDYTKVGTGPHSNFPLLISRTDTDLRDRALSNGNDILFTSSDGTTKLSHEIESYTGASGAIVAWVKIPSLSSSANTVIYMYYGNASATSQQNITGTWDASFRGVYHLNNAFSDATSNSNNGTNTGTTNVAGKIANGRGFDRSNGSDYIQVSGLMGSPSSFTLSAWASLTTADPNGAEIISLGDHLVLRYDENSGNRTSGVAQSGSGTWNTTGSGINYAGTGWHHVVYTFDAVGNSQKVYVDGVQVATSSYTADPYYSGGGTNTFIGKHGNANVNMDFDGTIDEARIANASRTAGWVLTEFNNQNSPSTFYSVGAQTLNCTTPPPPTVTSPVYYCQNAAASQLSATGSNLLWGGTGTSSGSVGGTSTLTATTWIDAQYGPSTNRIEFTTHAANVTITSVDFYVPSWQSVSGLVLSIYNSSGAAIATSSTSTTYTAGPSTVKFTSTFNYVIAAAGDYSIRASSGYGNIGGDNPSFPIADGTGTITVTGSGGGYRCFNNLQFSVSGSSSTAPTPSTASVGTTNYTVTQTVNGCVSDAATIAVIVNAPANISQIPTSNLISNYRFNGNASDATGNNNGTLQSSPASAADRFGNSGSAYAFNGSTQYVSTANSYSNPTNYTISVWFKTATNTGGKLIGFGNQQTGSSGSYDRQLYMNNAGQVYFGVYPGYVVTINSPLSYNDNTWHLATATMSSTAGMVLYIDGVQVAANANTGSQNYAGYWKVGYDNLNAWPSQPSSFFFNGTLDDILIYHAALNSSQVATLFNSPDGAGNNGPVCSASTLNLSATTASGATYGWSGPNGFSSSSQNPSLSYSSAYAGIYTLQVTLGACVTTAYTNVKTAATSSTISYAGSPYCSNGGTATVTFSGYSGGTYSSTAGLSINATTGAITLGTSTAGSYQVTYTVPGGCSSTANITITTLPSATISYSGTPFCKSVGTAQSVTRTGTSGGTYSASPAGLTINSSTGAITPSTSTAGSYTVTYTMAATGGCTQQTATTSVTITAVPSATISYSGTPYCKSVGTAQSVTRTGTSGGTYSASPAGLTINASTGAVTPSTSTAGTYTVTYTMAAAGGCSQQTATTSVTITALPSATISYGGSPYCVSVGSAQPVTLAGTGGGTYSALPAGLTINSSTGAITPSTSTAGTYTVTYTMAATGGCSQQTATTSVTIAAMPSVSGSSTETCVGGSTGTITASGSGGQPPYTYSLDAGAYQSGTGFTALAAGVYTLNIKSNEGCISSTPVTVNPYAASTDDQNAAGTDSWIGHVYDGTGFSSYIGHLTETETFDESFGGNTTCLNVVSNSQTRSIYTETFSIRYRMNSTRKGLYAVNLGSDDGSRLTVDGVLVYDNWIDQGFSTRSSVLISLNGSSSLLYEFYENGGGNRVIFQNLTPVIANTLSANTTQSICLGNAGSAISGDVFGTLPTGLTLSGTGYQWSYSTTPGGARTNIAGATQASFTPSSLSAPFNTPGTYYVYRTTTVVSANNISPNPYSASNESNAAVITVSAPPSATISYTGSPYYSNAGTASVTLSGTSGGTYSSTAGLSINSTTGAVALASSTHGTYTVTYTISASGGCSLFETTASITVYGYLKTWDGGAGTSNWGDAGNWSPDGVPAASDDVQLDGAHIINANVAALAKNISLNNTSLVLTVKSGNTLTVAGNLTLSSGTLNTEALFPAVTGTVSLIGGTVGFTGSGSQTVPAQNYYHLSSSSTGQRILSNSGTIGIAGNFTPGANSYTIAGSTIAYNGANAQAIAAFNYHNLTLGNSGTKTFSAGTTGVAATLAITGGATANTSANASTISYNGSIGQSVTALTYYGLNISSTDTVTIPSNMTVTNFSINSGVLHLNNFTLTTTGSATYASGKINNGTVTSSGPASTFSGTEFGAAVAATSNALYLNGSVFNSSASFTKNGATSVVCTGGNVYNGVTTISNSGSGSFDLGDTNPEIFNAQLTVNNSGSSRIQIGVNSAGNLFNGNVTINHGGNTSSVNTIIARAAASSATINGNLTLNCTNSNANSGIIIANDGAVTVNGNITVSSTNGRGILFGAANGSVVLGNGYTISDAGPGTFTVGTLTLNRFSQSGGTSQAIALGGTANLLLGPLSQFNGGVSFSAPQLFLNGCRFNGTALLVKNGATDNTSIGSNIFNGETTIINSGSGALRMANTSGDDFNNNVTFIQSASGLLQPVYKNNSTFSGNISTAGSVTSISFGAGVGTVTLDGAVSQAIQGTYSPTFYNLTVSSTAGIVAPELNCNIANNLTVSSGVFDLGGFTADRGSVGGLLTLSNGATLKIGGANSLPANYSTHSIGATSTIEYKGANQTVATLNSGQDYGHLVVSGPGTTTNSGNISVRNNLSITGAGSLDIVTSHVRIGGAITSNGAFYAGNGSIELNGSSAQVIPASAFYGNSIKGLVINNPANVTLAGSLALTDVLTISGGSLAANGYLRLRSTATGTARVAPITSVAPEPVTGNVIVERYIPGRRKYRLITSSVTTSGNQVLNPGEESLSIWGNWQNGGINSTPNLGNFITGGSATDGFDTQTPNASLFTYDDVNRVYVGHTTANGKNTKYTPLKAGIAYYMFVYGDRQNTITTSNPNNTVLVATGTLLTGNQTYTTSSSIPLSGVTGRYTLLGNPFASPIDWATITRSNLENTYWGWDPNLSSTGGYVTVSTLGNVTITSPCSGSTGLNQFIQPGQGFFVKTLGASPSMTIREQDKVADFNPSAFRVQGNELPLLAINLQYSSGAAKVLADGVVTVFDPSFSNQVAAEDASKLSNSAESVAFENGGQLLSIEGRKLPVNDDTLFLRVSKLTKPQYRFQVFAKQMGSSNVVPYLKDNYLQSLQPLLLSDTNYIDFTVNPSIPASVAANRFLIVFRSVIALPLRFVSFTALGKENSVSLKWSVAEEAGVTEYQVERSSDGVNFQKLGHVYPGGGNLVESYEWQDNDPGSGTVYYRIRAIRTNGGDLWSSTVSVKRESADKGIRVFPNPVQNGQINLHIGSAVEGRYMIILSDQNGRQVLMEMIDHPGGTLRKTISLKRLLAGGVYHLSVINKSIMYRERIMVE